MNALKGEMSLIGPYSEIVWLVDRFEPWHRKLVAIPQGSPVGGKLTVAAINPCIYIQKMIFLLAQLFSLAGYPDLTPHHFSCAEGERLLLIPISSSIL